MPATAAMKEKRVVILGFGPAGAAVARELAGKVRVVVVSKGDTYHHNLCVTGRGCWSGGRVVWWSEGSVLALEACALPTAFSTPPCNDCATGASLRGSGMCPRVRRWVRCQDHALWKQSRHVFSARVHVH